MSLYLWTLTQVVRCVKCFSLETEMSCAFFYEGIEGDLTQHEEFHIECYRRLRKDPND